jgi:four helix bundle protein
MNEETPTKRAIIDHKELRVYQLAFDAAMTIFDLTTTFPTDERYALSDQIRRSSRSICANLAEAWRKRRYEAAFLGKLSDCEAEAAETQTWLDFAINCQYISPEKGEELYMTYNQVLAGLVSMIRNPSPWLLRRQEAEGERRQKAAPMKKFSPPEMKEVSFPTPHTLHPTPSFKSEGRRQKGKNPEVLKFPGSIGHLDKQGEEIGLSDQSLS